MSFVSSVPGHRPHTPAGSLQQSSGSTSRAESDANLGAYFEGHDPFAEYTVKVHCCEIGAAHAPRWIRGLVTLAFWRAPRACTHFSLEFYCARQGTYAFTLERSVHGTMFSPDCEKRAHVYRPAPSADVPTLPAVKLWQVKVFADSETATVYNLFDHNCKHFVVDFWCHVLGLPRQRHMPRPGKIFLHIAESIEDQWWDAGAGRAHQSIVLRHTAAA